MRCACCGRGMQALDEAGGLVAGCRSCRSCCLRERAPQRRTCARCMPCRVTPTPRCRVCQGAGGAAAAVPRRLLRGQPSGRRVRLAGRCAAGGWGAAGLQGRALAGGGGSSSESRVAAPYGIPGLPPFLLRQPLCTRYDPCSTPLPPPLQPVQPLRPVCQGHRQHRGGALGRQAAGAVRGEGGAPPRKAQGRQRQPGVPLSPLRL